MSNKPFYEGTPTNNVSEDLFYKDEPTNKIWRVDSLGVDGLFLFSFDKKTIYNLWQDWDKLTGEQQDMVAAEYPDMAQLKGYPYTRKQD